jgi:hypothetical protein
MQITDQPPPEILAAARRRLGDTQQSLAARVTSLGAHCTPYIVERWETRSPHRHRAVPQHLWPQVRAALGLDDYVPVVSAPYRPVARDQAAQARTAALVETVAPLLRPAGVPTCVAGCCPRYECVRCGAIVVDEVAAQHVCRALGFLLAPSAELLAVLAERDEFEEVA